MSERHLHAAFIGVKMLSSYNFTSIRIMIFNDDKQLTHTRIDGMQYFSKKQQNQEYRFHC